MKNFKYGVVFASLFLAVQVHAFELKIEAQTATEGQAVPIVLEREESNSACGIELKYGDGNSKILRFEENVKTITEAYVYKYPGNYKVEMDGKMIFRGLGSTFHCAGLGKTKQLTITAAPNTRPQVATIVAPAPAAIVLAPPASLAPVQADVRPETVYAHRRALVIGNDSYKAVSKLENAREDARAIGENLTSVGYQVTLKLDVTQKEMQAVIRNFTSQVEGGDEVFFFFAGHGVQLGTDNYLLPVDITGENQAQVKDDAIPLQRILDNMTERKAKFTLAMVDACRDNPFKSNGRALAGRGLVPTTAATGQMVIYSAGAGQKALDKLGVNDKDKNGLFTRVFIKEMQKAGQPVDAIVKNVKAQVVRLAKSVGHDQVPAIYNEVIDDFYFKK